MIRTLYSLAMWAAQPFMRARLRRRAVAEPGYAVAPQERMGHYRQRAEPASVLVWVHAVSLGETRAAAIVIAALRQAMPGFRLLLTHGTATGREEGARLLQPGDVQVWQPWDTPGAVGRFLGHFRPRIGILMETEVWPNLSALCRQRGVPLVLANARLSAKSLEQALRLAWLARPAYRSLAAVWAQTQADADRLRLLGAPVRGVLGNVKFDAAPQAAQLAQGRAWRHAFTQTAGRPVLMFASSREGEEAALLQDIWQKVQKALVSIANTATKNIANQDRIVEAEPVAAPQWLIVPRHPQRFDAVAQLIQAQGFAVSRRSTWSAAGPPVAAAARAPEDATGRPVIWLGDSLGEMSLYYGLADVALLGGSFEPLGGQNLIEAAACECPVVMGPHTFNFTEAALLAEQSGAALRVGNLPGAVALAAQLAGDSARLATARQAAHTFSHAHRGATGQLVAALAELLSTLPSKPAIAKELP